MSIIIKSFPEKRKGYYYYFNWRAGQKNAIHWCECIDCNYGSGKRVKKETGLNGVWIGPFKKLSFAEKFITKHLAKPIKHHKCINQ
jgi:hypothetical protein